MFKTTHGSTEEHHAKYGALKEQHITHGQHGRTPVKVHTLTEHPKEGTTRDEKHEFHKEMAQHHEECANHHAAQHHAANFSMSTHHHLHKATAHTIAHGYHKDRNCGYGMSHFSNDLVHFDATPLGDVALDKDRWRVRDVKVAFRCGDYPDKQISVTPDEAKAACAAFTSPIDLDIEHRPSVFSGKIGKLVGIRMSDEDPSVVSARVALPSWLDDHFQTEPAYQKDPPKLSLSWGRQKKQVGGAAITCNPRISGTALFAAFTADEGMYGPIGPVPDASVAQDKPALSATQAGAVLQGGDLAKAICQLLEASITDAEKKKGVYDPAYCKKLKEMLKECEKMGGKMEKEKKEEKSQFADDPTYQALVAERDALKAAATKNQENEATRRKNNIEHEAALFFDEMVGQKRVLPGQKDSIVQMYVTAANADYAQFSATSTPGNNVSHLRKMVLAQPAHEWTEEQLKQTATGGVVESQFSNDVNAPVTPDRLKYLMELTSQGRVLYQEKYGKNGAAKN